MTLIGGSKGGDAVFVAWPPEVCPHCKRMAAFFTHYAIGPKGRRLRCLTCPKPEDDPPTKETP